MTEPRRPLSLEELRTRLAKARAERTGGGDADSEERQRSALGWAFRIGVELVAALVVGVGFGWLLDGWLGTMPLFVVVFFFLGAAAGALNVWRAVKGMGLAAGDPGSEPPAGESREDRD
ncbi:MAG: AtpZ/AtpI family protein [Alphaproteobacteria bacterium]|nr:AtpZ/AtpI family protein [Alphaproteobacteria bacterium]